MTTTDLEESEFINKKIKKCCFKCCTLGCTTVLLALFGVGLTITAAVSIPYLNNYFKSKVVENLIMKPGSPGYENWRKPPIPLYMKYYVFNYTNYQDVINRHAKPNLVQLGPYTYKAILENVILEETSENITYLQNYTYVFDRSESCTTCDEENGFITPNVPVITFLAMLKENNITEDSPIIYREAMKIFNTILTRDKTYTLFMKLTVKNYVWGYDSPFLQQLQHIITDIKTIIPKFIWRHFHIPDLQTHIVMQMNGTDMALKTGNMTILTGNDDIQDLQRIVKWKGKSTTECWLTPYGNMINGTDGTHTKPFMSRDEDVYIFSAQLFRSLLLNYDEDTSIFDIELFKFATTEKLFADSHLNPDNKAFCEPTRCYASGLIPLSNCQQGGKVPMFVSLPHFLHGDTKLWKALEGLRPEKSLHDTYISVEPITGIAMDAHIKFQININAMKIPFFTLTNCLSSDDNFLPMLFFHELASIDEDSAKEIRVDIINRKKLMTYFEYGVLGVGALLIVISFMCLIQHRRKKKREKENVHKKFVDK